MQRKGQSIPALLNRPNLPEYMGDILICYTDLVKEGEIKWVEFAQWAEEYGLQDREYAWEVINNARQAVDKWQSSRAKAQSKPAPQLTVAGRK